MQDAMEDVELEVITNDGNLAICKATVDGVTVDEVQFEREEDSKAEFLRVFPVGMKQTSKRFMAAAEDFENAKQKAFLSRSTAKTKKCNGKEQ
jgi:hypothetical protein